MKRLGPTTLVAFGIAFLLAGCGGNGGQISPADGVADHIVLGSDPFGYGGTVYTLDGANGNTVPIVTVGDLHR